MQGLTTTTLIDLQGACGPLVGLVIVKMRSRSTHLCQLKGTSDMFLLQANLSVNTQRFAVLQGHIEKNKGLPILSVAVEVEDLPEHSEWNSAKMLELIGTCSGLG